MHLGDLLLRIKEHSSGLRIGPVRLRNGMRLWRGVRLRAGNHRSFVVIRAVHIPGPARPARGWRWGMIMEYFVGVAIALGTFALGRGAKFDRERSFYSVMVVFVGSYYILFAAMGGSNETLVGETIVFGVFAIAAVVGFRTNLWIVAVALAGHGVLDFFHGQLIVNPGVPAWWPLFCMTFDVVAGTGLASLLLRSAKSGVPARNPGVSPSERSMFGSRIRPHVDAELRAAADAEEAGRAAEAFRYLERAHVLGQRSTIEHVRVHARMFTWGLRQGNVREAMSQAYRVIGAAIKTPFGFIPMGNTGGSGVSGLRPMRIPADLAAIISSASGPSRAG